MTIVTTSGLSEDELTSFKEEFMKSMNDPNYSLCTNFNFDVEQVEVDSDMVIFKN